MQRNNVAPSLNSLSYLLYFDDCYIVKYVEFTFKVSTLYIYLATPCLLT